MSVQVRLARPGEMATAYALRHEVFVIGQDVPPDLERDELDETAVHAIALDGDRIVGTGRLVDGRIGADLRLVPGTPGSIGTIGRVAVSDSARGSGVGRTILDLLVERARTLGLPAVELHAQLHAKDFYERAGFEPFGDVYLEAGIEHVGMRREL